LSKKTWLADIECYPNFFFLGIKDYKGKVIFSYEISPAIDQREELYKALTEFDGYFVTFNGEWYDNVVLNYILKDFERLRYLPILEFLAKVKEFSNAVIDDDFERIKYYRWFKNQYISVDLFLYWSKNLRISKKISLKSLGIQLGHPEVQELPYEHMSYLSLSEMEQVKRYNLVNDLGILELLFNKMKPDIGLRHFISTEYGLKCWSMDAPKISSEILLSDFCKSSSRELNDVRKYRFHPYAGKIGDLFDNKLFKYKHPLLQKVYEEILNSRRDFNKTFAFVSGRTELNISLGIGGIHSNFENKIFTVKDGEIYLSSDVASLYPTNIINHGICRFTEVLEKYSNIKIERLEAKKLKQKQKDTFLKLILNSFSGLIDNEYSWLYYPEGALKLRILGQLQMLKALDECIEKGYRVLALNTDSIDVIIDKNQEQEYYDVISKVEKQYNLVFEHEEIEKTIYSNINNYIQLSKSGKVKKKGFYKHGDDIPLGDSVNEQVVPKALELYFIKNIPIEESIMNPDKYGFHIYDYCKSNKIAKNYDVIYENRKIQNLNRYYFSKSRPYLFKVKKEKSTYEHVNVGEGVELFNKYEEKSWKDYGINYSHYISKARKIINEVQTEQIQLRLW